MSYDTIPNKEIVETTAQALRERGLEVIIVANRAEALEKIKEFIPKGASVNNGSSRTLKEIGLVDYLKSGTHGWNNLHAAVVAEKDPVQQARARKEAMFAEYYMGSVHAVAQTGEIVIASGSGSQLSPIAFTSSHILFVVGTQKESPTYTSAMGRLREYVFPLEDKRVKDMGMRGATISKILTFEREPAFMDRKVRIIFVNEKLGF
ncbi:MAG: LUD domain-containing protein [Candidatus Yonathbacteria bacterium]|nr:LUD domain-containing protein [Candidatus Yonathbacteria bacterium]